MYKFLTSMSTPLVISADILLSKRANVTFFSNLGSDESWRVSKLEPTIVDVEPSVKAVSRMSSESRDVLCV